MMHGDIDRPTVVTLRDPVDSDLLIFYEHQREPEGVAMAQFPSRSRSAFMQHWERILVDESVAKKTILLNETVVGNVVCWRQDDRAYVGYWIGRDHWGRGIATEALKQFVGLGVEELGQRDTLFAHVANSNVGSIRVLEKCGFRICSEEATDDGESGVDDRGVQELLYRLCVSVAADDR